MILWAYAIIITKNLKDINPIQLTIHIGYTVFFSNAILYFMMSEPIQLTFNDNL